MSLYHIRTDGYDITVKDNTTLTGSVIDSKAAPDKNSLTTGTLTMKDIENKASYEDSYRGIGYTYDRKYETIMGKAKDHLPISDEERTYVNDRYNRIGLVPDLGMPSSDSVTSTTQSAIAPGILLVTNEHLDPATVKRNTKDTLNALDTIFDKKKLEERQELTKLFAKNANEAIHQISESKGWEDGSKEKIALHTLVSGITAQLGGQSFADGSIAGGINEAVVGKLMDAIGKDNPDMVQIASAVLGYATNKLAGKDGEAGAAVAQWGTKWNHIDENKDYDVYLIYDAAPQAGHVARAYVSDDETTIVEYDSEDYASSDIISNGVFGSPVQGIIREHHLVGDMIGRYKSRGEKKWVRLSYTPEETKKEIQYYNNIMDNSSRAVERKQSADGSLNHTGQYYESYLQWIRNGIHEYYPTNGWKDYVLFERNCVIFLNTPVMASKYGYDRKIMYRPFQLYQFILDKELKWEAENHDGWA
ncbi:hypothetical protein [uncultured Veillonella sp.]|uniref:hypothetical protein n=1 Tax=uncultured Veillonella sp. TaxID=159268 RepID=UPI0025926504|nr:hypothetical protein [uncultured Veillonella sp.]